MKRFSRVLSSLLLLAYLLTGTMLLPATVAIFGSLGGEHGIAVRMDGGNVSVTLNHHGARVTPQVTDHNSPVSRVVTSICGLDSRGNHQVSSRSMNPTLSIERELLRTIEKAPTPSENGLATLLHRLLDQGGEVKTASLPKWQVFEHAFHARPRPMMATVQLLV